MYRGGAMASLLLALSLSVDALGIGISYGLRKIRTTAGAKVIICIISFLFTAAAISAGNIILMFIPPFAAKLCGGIMLGVLGLYIIFSNLLKKPETFDTDSSKYIDMKEAIFLGAALSVDSIGTGICSAVAGVSSFIIPVAAALFQLLFLCAGSFLGSKIVKLKSLPCGIFVVISGLLLVIIALIRVFCE